MAKPLSWNTLKQAAVWLSDKTKEEWTEDRIIDFAIQQCRPDDIVEDIKYPSYLRAVLTKSQVDLISKALDIKELFYSSIELQNVDVCKEVFGEVVVNNEDVRTTLLFKENLINLQTDKEVWIKYVGTDNQSINSIAESHKDYLNTTVIYCELSLKYVRWGAPVGFPPIPPIQIDKNLIGIRDEDIKQLLRDYLNSKSSKATKKLTEPQQDKLDCQAIAKEIWTKNPQFTKVEVINLSALAPYKNKYKGKNTLSDWLKEIDPRPLEKRRGRPCKNTRQ